MRIEVRELSLRIKGTSLLERVSLEIPDGSFISVLGESGAGKTTLLNIICGLTVQDSGSVLFDGCPVDDLPPNRRDVTVVFQEARLFPNMSVLDNVAFPLRVRGVKRAERRLRAADMLERVRLPNIESRRPGELSGGQRQRVALARALVASPRAALLDEPFSGLDESLREDMRSLVLELHDDLAITMLMVTHDPLEALTMSDQVAYLSRGRLLQTGAPNSLLLHPASREVGGCFKSASALEGIVADEVFIKGKLRIPARGVRAGSAILLRTSDGGIRVYPRETLNGKDFHE